MISAISYSDSAVCAALACSARGAPWGGWASGKWTLPSGRAVAKAIQAIAARAGEAAAEPAALPAPNGQSSEAALEPAPLPKSKHKPNRLMLEADTAVGPRERIPRKMRPPAGE